MFDLIQQNNNNKVLTQVLQNMKMKMNIYLPFYSDYS